MRMVTLVQHQKQNTRTSHFLKTSPFWQPGLDCDLRPAPKACTTRTLGSVLTKWSRGRSCLAESTGDFFFQPPAPIPGPHTWLFPCKSFRAADPHPEGHLTSRPVSMDDASNRISSTKARPCRKAFLAKTQDSPKLTQTTSATFLLLSLLKDSSTPARMTCLLRFCPRWHRVRVVAAPREGHEMTSSTCR